MATMGRLALVLLIVMTSLGSAQLKTIPEQLAQAGVDLVGGASVPSGFAPTVDAVLEQADVIVQGVVGAPRTYLSQDQMNVLSDYPLVRPTVLFDSKVAPLSQPGIPEPEIVVTVRGGKITIGGLTYTERFDALPKLEPGSECLLLLKRVGNRLHIAGDGHFGAFEVEGGRLKPLTRVHGFAPTYRGMPTVEAAQAIVSRRRLISK